MRIQVDVEVPDGEYCNKPCKTGCQFLEGVSRIGRCFCVLFKKHLENLSLDYTVCDANIKCEECLEYTQQ